MGYRIWLWCYEKPCFSASEDEIGCTKETEGGPEIVQFQGLLHIEHGKGDEDREGDDFLKNFELGQADLGIAQPVGRHHQHVFEQGNAPGEQGGNPPGTVCQVPEERVSAKDAPVDIPHVRQK